LRRKMLKALEANDALPVIMETHGGKGAIYSACYRTVQSGVVFEKDREKAGFLALQRPTWAVYEADCVGAIAHGAGAHLEVNVLDVDPYGEPWPTIRAFFESERPRTARLYVVVNDGLRQKLRISGGWHVASITSVVSRFGSDLQGKYLAVCEIMIKELAAKAGYSLSRFAGYYCGAGNWMTHYLAELGR